MTQEEKQEEGRDLYGNMATEVPERKVEVEVAGEPKSLEDKEAETEGLSDLATALKTLFPKLGNEIHNALMMARVAPDMFIPLIRILVNSEIRRMDPRQSLNVAEQAALFYVLTSIGLDGKGRIDTIELAGSITEAEDLKELSKGLGI